MPTQPRKLIPGVPEEKQDPRAWREYTLPAEKRWFEEWEASSFARACNPFAKVYPLNDHVYGIYNRSASGATDSWSFLIIGSDTALLLDTGHAIGDLKALVEELLNGKPYLVVNTHCHADHSLGNVQFPSVYVPEYDVESLAKQMRPDFWREYSIDKIPPERRKHFFGEQDVMPFSEYEIVPYTDGQLFSLGGVTLEAIWTPGHSAGECAFLDKEDRILFSGDTITAIHGSMGELEDEFQAYPEYITVEAYQTGIQRLADRINEYDCLFPAHGRLFVEKQIVTDMLAAVAAVLKDHEDYDYIAYHNGQIEKHKLRGLAVLTYMDHRFAKKIKRRGGKRNE